MSLFKLPNFGFLAREILLPVLTAEVCVTGAGGLNTERLLFSLRVWMTLYVGGLLASAEAEVAPWRAAHISISIRIVCVC